MTRKGMDPRCMNQHYRPILIQLPNETENNFTSGGEN
jgi:hypothetical protein